MKRLWLSPVTFAGLVYVTMFRLLGWYTYVGHGDIGYVWYTTAHMPGWLMRAWQGWGGHTIGQVIVLAHDLPPDHATHTLKHELEHVRQGFRLGPFQPVLYLACWLAIRFGCPGLNAYHDNPLEVAARKVADQ